MNPVLLLSGYAVLSATAEQSAALLNVFLQRDAAFSGFMALEDGSVQLTCSLLTAKRLQGAAEFTVLRRGGLPVWLLRARSRMGLVVGGLLAVALLLVSRLFVWDVRVTGNRELSAAEVLEELSACGFGVGSYLPAFSVGEVENRVLLASKRLAWISVHLNGTVAEVQVLERTPAPDTEEPKKPADLIAKIDGQIELVELYRGNSLVRPGQAVRRGELLVSGIFESESNGCRFTRSAGRVLARTEHTYRIEIPLADVEREYYATEKAALWLIFFGNPVKISENAGNGDRNCDIIEEVIHADRLGLPNLPLSWRREIRRYWREVERTRTQEEAVALAFDRLAETLRTLSDEVQLLSKRSEVFVTDTAVVLECTVTCIEDIAEQVEFEVID